MSHPHVEAQIHKAPVNIQIGYRTIVTMTFEAPLSSLLSHIQMDFTPAQKILSEVSTSHSGSLPKLVASAVKDAMERWPDDETLQVWWRETGYEHYCHIDKIVATHRLDSIEHGLKDFVDYWKSHLEVSQYDACRNFLFWAMEYLDHCQMILEAGAESFSNRVNRSTMSILTTWEIDSNVQTGGAHSSDSAA